MTEVNRRSPAPKSPDNPARDREHLAMAMEGGRIGFWDWEVKSGHVTYGHIWSEILGYDVGEIGEDYAVWESRIHPEDRTEVLKNLAEHLEGRSEMFRAEHRLRSKSGEWVWVLGQGSVRERDATGSPLRVSGIMMDIAEHKQAEEALWLSERYVHSILETAQDGFWVLDRDGRFIDVNSAYCAMSGYTREEILQFRIPDIDAIEGPEEAAAHARLVREKGTDVFETRHRRKDGSIFDVEVSVTHMGGQDERSICFCRDITERKRAEEAASRRILALTGPSEGDTEVAFEDLFDLDEIQRLQDDFAAATNVASLITHPDGIPLTAPSNFCRLCSDIIRKTEKGAQNCRRSDALLGQKTDNGPRIQPCTSSGLCDAGAAITVGGRHIANWLIGQVRDGTQSEEKIREYAREIGADEDEAAVAFHEIPLMSREQFAKVAQALFTLANQLSAIAYQNLQQARAISERERVEEALRKSEERLQAVLFGANLGTWDWFAETNVVTFDERWTQMLGFDLHEVPPHFDSWESRVHPDDLPATLELLNAHLKGECEHYEAEYRMRHKSGRWVWILDRGRVIERDDAGQPLRISGTHQDVTDRKTAELALQESEKRYRALFEEAPVGIFRTNPQGQILTANPAMLRLLDLGSVEEAQEHYPNLAECLYVHPEKREEFVRLLNKKGSVEDFEYEARTATGRIIWLGMDARLVPGTSEEGPEIEGYTMEITDRKRAAEALRGSEERFRSLADNIPGIVYLCRNDERYSMLYLNDAMESITGYTRDAFIENRICFFDLFHPEDTPGIVEKVDAAIARGEPYNLVYRMRHKNGTWRWVEEYGTAVYLDGEVQHLEGFIADITERKETEAERERLEEQLLQAQKMESVGRLAGGVAHDFNNMLNVILGHVEIAREELTPEHQVQANLKEIGRAAERSADLTRQLLAYARKQTIAPKVLDLNEAVANSLAMLGRLIGEDIDLIWEPSPKTLPVRMDPAQVDQLLTNLCVNARDAIADTGKITIETASVEFDEAYCESHAGVEPGAYAMLAVSDDGCGMDAVTQEHLFEPFFTTKGVGEGTGLGLATVYGIVKQNNGFLSVYSEPEHGTTIKLYLTRYGQEVSKPAGPPQEKQTARGKETLLVVEDEKSILDLTAAILRRLGYQVLPARSPVEAIELARQHHGEIHLLLTDVVMPEMNGRELAKQLLSLYPDMRRLFMSGYTANVIAHHGVLENGVNFIQKPFSAQGLGNRVREALDRTP